MTPGFAGGAAEMANAWTVVLAGGVGSRFWPMSTPSRPKQLLALVDEHPLLANTLARLAPLVPAERTLVLTNATLRDAVRALAPELPSENVIAEPAPAGTCAALAWASRVVAARGGRDAVMICVHADWAIADPEGFRSALRRAGESAAAHASLVTVGVVPTRDDPGFGYIQPGDVVAGAAADAPIRRVARFVEKPTRERAARMRADGYLWNSGIFVWRAGDFLAEVDALAPEVGPALRNAGDDIARFFADVTPVAVDVAVMERSHRVLVIPGDFGWDDVGTWGALARVRARDEKENAPSGAVFALDARRNVVHADGNAVVLYGVDDLVVVTRPGLTLVTTPDRSSDLKALLEALPTAFRN
ncbi:MAG TPA: sugar phosphate nucleotidyltransferase [Gemmatirosa sp.]